MFVVLDEAAEQSIFQTLERGISPNVGEAVLLADLSAVLHQDELVITVNRQGDSPQYLPHTPGQPLNCYAVLVSRDEDPSTNTVRGLPADTPFLLIAGDRTSEDPRENPLRAFLYSPESPTAIECGIEVVRLETDVFSRVKGIFDNRALADKVVCVVGMGSGGGIAALELAKAGVGNFSLIDFDRLKAHNISRHVCGLADVGRFKTRAVRDRILQHNPMASVQCHEVDITEDDDLLYSVVSESDLVIVATDTELSRYLINEACLASGTPAVYGGVYERAFAGEVIRVIPGNAGCYACVRQGMAGTMRNISSDQVVDYTDDTGFQAEPGLGLDVSFIALIHAKVALLTLLRDVETSLEDINADMIIWTNAARPEDGELFEQPMARTFVRVVKNENCPSCGPGSDIIIGQTESGS